MEVANSAALTYLSVPIMATNVVGLLAKLQGYDLMHGECS